MAERPAVRGTNARSGLAAVMVVLVVALAALLVVFLPGGARASTTSTIVSLTFDDGTLDQYQNARSLLSGHGVHATFFVNSGRVGSSGYMSVAQLRDLAGDGHEITGHTVDHLDLTTLSSADAQHQVCDDRQAILAWGFSPVSSFAYPFGSYNASVETIVKNCGYSSARGVGGVVSPTGCSGCPYAQALPPADPYALITPDSIKGTTTLSQLEGYVSQAEQHGGGWLLLVMHHVCAGCTSTYYIAPSTLSSFLDWLVPRAVQGTSVQTVQQVLGGSPPPPPSPDTTAPVSTITCNGSACQSGWYAQAVSVSLAASDEAAGSGLAKLVYTLDGSDPTQTNGTTYTGAFSLSSSAQVRYRAYDNAGNAEQVKSQPLLIDTRPPQTSASCNGAACTSGWYASALTVTLSASDTGSGVARTVYTLDGSTPSASNGTLYGAPFPVPASALLKFASWDTAGNAEPVQTLTLSIDTQPPTVAITAPTSGATVSGRLTIQAAAADSGGSGVSRVSFYIDGQLLATDSSAPYSASWQTRKWTAGNHSLTALATDGAGNTTTSAAVTVTRP